jgi:probable rRNA maturation factor
MISLQVDATVRGRLSKANLQRLRRRLARMLEAVRQSEARAEELEMTLRLTGDAEIHELNRDYRGKDRPTDVLAFAQREGEGAEHCPEVLGDLVISLETATRQARKGLFAEVLHLASHGLCHLIGYDHRDDEEEREMNQRMAALLAEAERRGPVRAA